MQLVEPLLDWLDARQLYGRRLLHAGGVAEPPADEPAAMIPLASYVDLFERAAAASGDLHLGLRLARFDEPGTLGALGYLFMSGASLLDAFEGFCGHLDALQEDTTNRLLISGETVAIHYRINDEAISHRRQDSEYSIAAMSNLTRLYSDTRVRPHEVMFEHRQAGKYSTYRDYFQCEVHFEQPINALVYRREGFNVRSTRRDHLLNTIIASHLSALSARAPAARTVTARVLEVLDSRGLAAECDQRTVAAALGLSVSTLIRRLRAEGTSFRALLLERRLQQAERLLRLDDRPVAAVALAVGYSENASFTRAFRQKYAQSPDQFRRACRRSARLPMLAQ